MSFHAAVHILVCRQSDRLPALFKNPPPPPPDRCFTRHVQCCSSFPFGFSLIIGAVGSFPSGSTLNHFFPGTEAGACIANRDYHVGWITAPSKTRNGCFYFGPRSRFGRVPGFTRHPANSVSPFCDSGSCSNGMCVMNIVNGVYHVKTCCDVAQRCLTAAVR